MDLAISVEVPADELVRRLSGRWVCREAGHVYNETARPPRVPGRCDIDGSELIQRADDKPETIQARLELQLSSLREVIETTGPVGSSGRSMASVRSTRSGRRPRCREGR